MMTLEEMKERKKDLGYTNEIIAEMSGLPLSTVQKVFCGATKNPRYNTLEALEMVLKKPLQIIDELYETVEPGENVSYVAEEALDYNAASEKKRSKKVSRWLEPAPSERWPRQGEYTVEDVLALPEEVRVELIDGYIYDLATPTVKHQRIVGYLYLEFNKCIETHAGDCEVFLPPLSVKLNEQNTTLVEPDLMIACGEDLNKLSEKYFEEPPGLVVEVLSPSTRDIDCTTKLFRYMYSGVKEYWIVDPKKERVIVYCFEEDVLPQTYTFDDSIPVGISGGECEIDFGIIKNKLEKVKRQ